MRSKHQILVGFFEKNKLLSLLTLACGLFASLLAILLPVSLGRYFELLFGTGSRRAAYLHWLPDAWLANVPAFLVFFFAMVALRTAFHFGQTYGSGLLGERFARQVREQLFEHQLSVQTTIYDQTGIGKYLLRYSGDLQGLQRYLTLGILQFSVDAMLLFIALAFMASLSLVVTGIGMGSMALTAGLVYLLNKRLSLTAEARRGSRSSLLAFVNERLLIAATLKAFNKEVTEVQKFGNKSADLYAFGQEYQQRSGLVYALVPGLVYAGLGATLIAIYQLHQRGQAFDTGALLALIMLFITILPALRRVLRASTVWQLGDISFRKLLKVMRLEAEQQGLPNFKFKRGKVVLKELEFGFSKKKPLIQGLSLSALPGQITVLLAPNGFGKTTLVKLLMGIYTTTKGEISVDGQDVGQVDLTSLRRKITAVSDGFALVGPTVFEAVSYSRKPEKRPAAAAMLERLQHGLPTENRLNLDKKIGENGLKLSAGHRKLLHYARAFLSDKPILLVDEPFADLPAELRINVAQLLAEKSKGRTTILLVSAWNDDWLHCDELIKLDKPQGSKNLNLPDLAA